MLFWNILRVQTSVLLKFYGPVMYQNRPDVGNIIPLTRFRPDCFIYCKTCHVISFIVCIDILKIVNWNRHHPLDKRYGFSISVQPEVTSLSKVFFLMLKNVFQKLAGLWLVGEVVNHVGLYGAKVAEGCSAFQRRSCYSYQITTHYRVRATCACVRIWQ